MTENKNVVFLKVVLIIFAIICIVYGIGYFFFPDKLVEMSGGSPVHPGWLRWSGGILVALGIGSILVFLKPKGQFIFVTTMALGSLFSGIGLLWAWFTIEEGVKVWFTALPAIVILVISGLLWLSLNKAKDA